MGAVFAPADIAQLVANFPPLSISTTPRPPLLRSFSKNNLKNSAEVLAYFKALVEQHDQRILRSSLTSLLGIEEGSESIIIDQLDSQLYYDGDARYIIPHPLIEQIAAVLKERASRLAVDLHAFAREQEIRYDSLERMIEEYSGQDWPRVIIDIDTTSYLCSHQYSEDVKTQIHNATSDAGLNVCNLSSILGHDVPSPIVLALATETTASKGGKVQYNGDQVIYIPEGYHEVSAGQDEQARTTQTAHLLAQLDQDGFCTICSPDGGLQNGIGDDLALVTGVMTEFERSRPGSSRLLVIDVTPEAEVAGRPSGRHKSAKLIVKPELLRDELDGMKLAIGTRAGILWRTNPTTATPANVVRNLQHIDYETQHREELADLLMRSSYAKELEATALNCLPELESERHGQFVDLVSSRLWCPLHCYTAGTLEVQDITLKQHLEDFLTIHFKADAVPSTIAVAREQGFLHDKSRKREVDKCQKAIEGAKSFDDIQRAISRLARKLNIATPSESSVFDSKSLALSQTLKSMQRMKRGSDVLQNLIWVLLATTGPGLFMSSGKDTSRMIKHFDSICEDPEVAGMLVIWRDKLKGGMEDEEDIRQMRELAKNAVEEWAEMERRRPYAGT